MSLFKIRFSSRQSYNPNFVFYPIRGKYWFILTNSWVQKTQHFDVDKNAPKKNRITL